MKPLTPEEQTFREGLVKHVNYLAVTIGERNIGIEYKALNAAADYLEGMLRGYGYTANSQKYLVGHYSVRNIEVQIKGSKYPDENLIVGGHYDSVVGTPGANDNASGAAAVLEIARVLKDSKPERTIRFVLFVNEEPPYFQNEDMGSLVYAKSLREQNVKVTAMFSLETIGYYSDERGSQKYPPGLSSLFPDTGNFIGFVSDASSCSLLRKSVKLFRESTDFPSEGVCAPESIPGVGFSDHWSFWQVGYPGVMITDTAPFRYPYYHDRHDTPDKIDFDRTARVVTGVNQVILKLANGK